MRPHGTPISAYGGRVPPRLATAPALATFAAALLLPTSAAWGVPAAIEAVAAVPGGATTASTVREQAPAGLESYYGQQLTWTSCLVDLTCAWVTVPLDYADPSGDTIRLRLSKSAATGPAASRQGSILINPGGPGGSGVTFTGYVAQAVAPEVAVQFDFVGFDPRGVGESAPISCLTGRQQTRWLQTDGSPDTAAEQRLVMSLASGIGTGCLDRSPRIARHVGTENTVRDMDIIRAVLGEQKLNWLGYSYGTYLGALYIEAFPDRVGRMVLDGAVDPSLNSMGLSEGQSQGFNTALVRFARDCASRPTCPIPGTTASVLRGINRLLASLDQNPMPAADGRVLTQAEGITAVIYPMYAEFLWRELRGALREAMRGDGTQMLQIADFANGRVGPDEYDSNMLSAFYSISCWDSSAPPGRAGLAAAAREWSADARVPEVAKSLAWGNAPCTTWYGHAQRAPGPIVTTTTAPVLIVGTTFDPATPYEWAVSLSGQIATSRLLTFRGDGHTAYGSGSRCADDAIDAFLLAGTLPAPGTVCR